MYAVIYADLYSAVEHNDVLGRHSTIDSSKNALYKEHSWYYILRNYIQKNVFVFSSQNVNMFNCHVDDCIHI